MVNDSRGIEIVNFTISLALSAGTLMASAGTSYRLVPAHFYHWEWEGIGMEMLEQNGNANKMEWEYWEWVRVEMILWERDGMETARVIAAHF